MEVATAALTAYYKKLLDISRGLPPGKPRVARDLLLRTTARSETMWYLR